MVEETKDTDELKNEKENRRRELLQQLDAGTLEKQEDIEFLLNQYLKDKEIELGDAGKKHLEEILTKGKGNFKSIFKQYEDIQQQNLSSRLKTEVYPIGGAEAMASTQIVSLDLGLSDVLSKIDEVEAKDNLYQDIIEARRSAAEHKYKGTEDRTDLRANLYNQLDDVKWYQFKRRRDTDKAIRDINPDDYWKTKKVSGNPILAASGYYSARQWLANRQHRRYESAKKQLETNVKDTIRDSELRWFSKDFGQKLGLRAKKLFRPSTDKLIKRLTANGNITELENINKQYAALGTEYKEKVPEGSSRTQLQQRYSDTVGQVIEQVKKGCQDRITVLEKEYGQAKQDAGNIYSPEVKNIRKKYIAQLKKVADSINKNTLNDVRNCPAYKAYLTAYERKPDEKDFSPITEQGVLKQILYNKVQSGEMTEAKASQHMELFFPEQPETPTPENSQTEEHKQENDVSKDTIVGNRKEERDINEEDYTPFEIDAKTLPGYDKEGETYLSTLKGNVKNISYKNANGHTVQFLRDKENRSFVLKARDKNGNRRYPTEEEEKTMAEAIKAAGVKSITIDRTYGVENCYKALINAGIAINNEDEVLEQIEKEQDRKNIIQKLRDTNKELVTTLERVQGDKGPAFGEYDIDKILYENKDSIEKDSALFRQAIVALTPKQAEEMRGKEDIGTQVKKVVENKISTEATQELENDAHSKNDSGNGQGSGSGDAQDEASKGESGIPSIVSSSMEDSIKTPSVEDSNQPTAEQGKEDKKFESIEDVRASVYGDTSLTDEGRKARLEIIQKIDRGDYVDWQEDVIKTFGKDSLEGKYLADIAIANELRESVTEEKDIKALNDLIKEVGIEGQTHLDSRLTEVRKVVHGFEGNNVDKDSPAYQALSKEEQKYVDTLCKARKNARPKKGETPQAAMDKAESIAVVNIYNKALQRKSSKAPKTDTRGKSTGSQTLRRGKEY